MNSNRDSKSVLPFAIHSFGVGLIVSFVGLVGLSVLVPLPRPYFFVILAGVSLSSYRLTKYRAHQLTIAQRNIASLAGATLYLVLELLLILLVSPAGLVFPLVPPSVSLSSAIASWVFFFVLVLALTRLLWSSLAE